MKLCDCCGEVKPISDFARNPDINWQVEATADNTREDCKKCRALTNSKFHRGRKRIRQQLSLRVWA